MVGWRDVGRAEDEQRTDKDGTGSRPHTVSLSSLSVSPQRRWCRGSTRPLFFPSPYFPFLPSRALLPSSTHAEACALLATGAAAAAAAAARGPKECVWWGGTDRGAREREGGRGAAEAASMATK